MKNKKLVLVIPFVSVVIYGIFVFLYLTKTFDTGVFCGGFANYKCQGGEVCKLEGNHPDAIGKCHKKLGTTKDILKNPFVVFELLMIKEKISNEEKNTVNLDPIKISEIYAKKSEYNGRKVLVQGNTRKTNVACTMLVCTGDNQCCNSCSGGLVISDESKESSVMVNLADRTALLINKVNGPILCTGNECELNCPAPFEDDGFYEIEAVVNIAKDFSNSTYEVELLVDEARKLR